MKKCSAFLDSLGVLFLTLDPLAVNSTVKATIDTAVLTRKAHSLHWQPRLVFQKSWEEGNGEALTQVYRDPSS